MRFTFQVFQKLKLFFNISKVANPFFFVEIESICIIVSLDMQSTSNMNIINEMMEETYIDL